MIEIIISENDDNDGRPLKGKDLSYLFVLFKLHKFTVVIWKVREIQQIFPFYKTSGLVVNALLIN